MFQKLYVVTSVSISIHKMLISKPLENLQLYVDQKQVAHR